MSEMGRTRIGLLRTYVPRQRLIPAGTRPAPGMSQQPSIYHGASTQTLVGHYGCRRTSVASAFWLFFAASMATPVIMHAKAMLAPTINSVIKMIMRSVNCDACASFVRPRPHAATTAKGPFISWSRSRRRTRGQPSACLCRCASEPGCAFRWRDRSDACSTRCRAGAYCGSRSVSVYTSRAALSS